MTSPWPDDYPPLGREADRNVRLRRRAWWLILALLTAVWALVALAVFAAARAAPPPKGSDDWNVMAPFEEWVTGRHDASGRWCCDIGDGRPVDAEVAGDHWRVHVTKRHFPDEADRWMDVPDEKVIRESNPTGSPILWLYQGRVQCFAPPDGA